MYRGNLHYRNWFLTWPGVHGPLWGLPERSPWTVGMPIDLHPVYPHALYGAPKAGLWQSLLVLGGAGATGGWLVVSRARRPVRGRVQGRPPERRPRGPPRPWPRALCRLRGPPGRPLQPGRGLAGRPPLRPVLRLGPPPVGGLRGPARRPGPVPPAGPGGHLRGPRRRRGRGPLPGPRSEVRGPRSEVGLRGGTASDVGPPAPAGRDFGRVGGRWAAGLGRGRAPGGVPGLERHRRAAPAPRRGRHAVRRAIRCASGGRGGGHRPPAGAAGDDGLHRRVPAPHGRLRRPARGGGAAASGSTSGCSPRPPGWPGGCRSGRAKGHSATSPAGRCGRRPGDGGRRPGAALAFHQLAFPGWRATGWTAAGGACGPPPGSPSRRSAPASCWWTSLRAGTRWPSASARTAWPWAPRPSPC